MDKCLLSLRCLLILILLIDLLVSCENNTNGIRPEISFSDDTIFFDTVFATVGSVTKELKVYNDLKNDIVIDRIYLAGGSTSQFRLNIDGEPAYDKKEIILAGGDSIYIFIDVIIDPLSSSSPLLVSDSIIFITAGESGKVILQAWGQDVVLLRDRVIKSENWTDEKPYLVYGHNYVDTSEVLTIDAGAKIYFHRNSSLTVAGRIVVNGTNTNNVLFASDRLEKMYEDVPGQWEGIKLLNTSHDNLISHAVIRGAVVGLQVGETVSGILRASIKLYSSEVSHCTVSGLSVINGDAEAVNSVFSHCGNYCIYLAAGGDFDFTHCSVYNFWEYGYRQTPALFVTEKALVEGGLAGSTNLVFNNSMIYGDLFSEIEIVPDDGSFKGSYYFDHCLIRLDTANSAFWSNGNYPSAIINKDPGLKAPYEYNFMPDSLSIMIDKGNPAYGILYPFDKNEVSRISDKGPDIGAYEWVATEK